MIHKLKINILGLKNKCLFIVGISLIIGVSTSSLFWFNKVNNNQSLIDYRNFEIKNLNDQIYTLRNEQQSYLNPTPTPTPIPYVKKEDLSAGNTYQLSCFSEEEIKNKAPNYDWIEKLKNRVPNPSEIIYLCNNQILSRAILITRTAVETTALMRPQSYKFELWIYFPASDSFGPLDSSTGNFLGGACNKIIAWTKTDSVYYQCSSGDIVGNTITYRLKLSNLNQQGTKGIVESCNFGPNTISCTNYCQSSSECKSGSFCNLENNTCVKSCQTDKDCSTSICKPFGPVKGCT